MTTKIGVLIVDDEPYVRDSMADLLRAENMRVVTAAGASEALDVLAKKRFDVIVTDLRMPSGDGLMLLEESRAAGISIPILVITGAGTVADAVAAMKAGAFDFLQKPIDPDELVLLVKRAAERRELEVEVASLRRTVARLGPPPRIVAHSPAMARVKTQVEQVAATDSTVLVRGESGTGKELVAAEIHRLSARARGPLVMVDVASLTEDGFDAELTGARGKRGRLTEAMGGTMVLDNVGAMPPVLQARFLRLLETPGYKPSGEVRARESDVRWIATTSEDLKQRVAQGTFRADLLFRLAVFPMEVPPLRERREDLPELAAMLVAAARARISGSEYPEVTLDDEVIETLLSYGWPGNVRELGNVLERATIVAQRLPIDAAILRSVLETNFAEKSVPAAAEFNLRRNLDIQERGLVLKAIARTRGKKREACDLLGIDARNLGYYLRKHKIREDEMKQAAES